MTHCCGPAERSPAVESEDELVGFVAADPSVADLEAMLHPAHPVYAGRGSAAVTRMRGWLLLALGRHGVPDSALPFVLEELEAAFDPYLAAAAAAVLRRRAAPSPELVPPLLAALTLLDHRDDAVSLTEYGGYGLGGERTTAEAEVLATLTWLGPAARAALPVLRDLRARARLPATQACVEHAIAAIDGDAPAERGAAPLPGHGGTARLSVPSDEVRAVQLEDQDGRVVRFGEFFAGRPSVVAFFYTRCENPAKCSLTMTRLGRLQRLLAADGRTDELRIAAISYDPRFDEPARLRRYARTWGFAPNEHHRLLRTVDGLATLRPFFELGVNYTSGVVNRHQIEVYLLDPAATLTAAWTQRQWDEAVVAKEAAAALAPV